VILNITEIPVFYINLDNEVGKKNKIEKVLKRSGFKNINRFPGTFSRSKNIGCNISHKKLLEKITKENIYPSIILEDDVGIKKFRKEIFIPDFADCMYIGISSFGYLPEVNLNKEWSREVLEITDYQRGYHRMLNMLSSHAMIRLNKDYDEACILQMEKVLKNPKKYVTNDVAVAMIHKDFNVYALNKPIFYQDDPRTKMFTHFDLNQHKNLVNFVFEN